MKNPLTFILMPYPETKDPWPWRYVLLALLKLDVMLQFFEFLAHFGVLYAVGFENSSLAIYFQSGKFGIFDKSYAQIGFFIDSVVLFIFVILCYFLSRTILIKIAEQQNKVNTRVVFVNVIFYLFIFILNTSLFLYNFYSYMIFNIILLFLCRIGTNFYLRSQNYKPVLCGFENP